MRNKVSVGSSAFALSAYSKNPIPLEKVADKLQELGFQGIELFGARPYGHPDDYPNGSSRNKLASMFKKRNLEISNYGADFAERSPASNDPQERSDYRRLFTKNLQFCVDCDIPSIRVDTVNEPPLPPGVKYETTWQRVVDTWHSCAEEADKEGVLVVWEFEPGFMFNKPHEVVKLVEEVGHPNFKVLFDVCHAHMCSVVAAGQEEPLDRLEGGEVEFAKLLKGKIGYVHLIDSDNTLHDNWTSTHAPFGQGVVDFDAGIEAVLQAGYRDDWWTIDLCFWPKAWEILPESKKFVDVLLKRHNLL